MRRIRGSGRVGLGALAGVAAVVAGVGSARAGGSPENILLIIHPGSAESMYIGNYYKHARGIPDANVLYIDPAPATYADFSAPNGALDALFGQLRNARLDAHIDYIVIASTGSFFVSAPGYVTDGCSPVTRFSQTSVFTMAHLKQTILAGGVSSQTPNQYFSTGSPIPFDGRTTWLFGSASTNPAARRYFAAAQLGYTGPLGNTVPEILTMIDRAVQADGTRPTGTFYLMSTTDPLRNVRSPQFGSVETQIDSGGGACAVVNGILPDFQHDCLGVLTGWADPIVDTATMTLLPGCFGDHLTSYAATFDTPSQTKCSAWVRRGVAGTSGTVEEPCNYTGKFVHANFHNLYFKGMSLGEAWLRSMSYVPFQGLLLGDPMCRPFARFPSITSNAPAGLLSGPVSFTPVATTPVGGASIATLDLYIDGVLHSRRTPGQAFTVNPQALDEGHHEWRILAADNTAVRTVGRWTGTFSSTLYGRTVSSNLGTATGDLNTLFTVNAMATPGATELRLLHNGRVVAAAPGDSGALQVYGRNIGAGQGSLQVEAYYGDRRVARGTPHPVTIAYATGAPSGLAPAAYGYTKRVASGGACVVELPARFDDALSGATWTVVTPPAVASISGGTLGYRTITVPPGACGQDQIAFRVQTPGGLSNTATVNLVYGGLYPCFADIDGDGALSIADFTAFLFQFASNNVPRVDANGDCALNVADFTAYLQHYAIGCP